MSSDLTTIYSTARGKGRGYYSERQLARKQRDERRTLQAANYPLIQTRVSPGILLLRNELTEVISRSSLSPVERGILRLYLQGESASRIARDFGWSRFYALKALRRIKRKLQSARNSYCYAGLWEIYSGEVRRGGRR